MTWRSVAHFLIERHPVFGIPTTQPFFSHFSPSPPYFFPTRQLQSQTGLIQSNLNLPAVDVNEEVLIKHDIACIIDIFWYLIFHLYYLHLNS